MRKLFFIGLIVAISVSRSSFAQTLSINFSETTPIIDGQVDETWGDHTFEDIDKNNAGEVSSEEDLSGQFKVFWDQNNIYLLVVVVDDIFHSDNELDIWNEDGVEVFIDATNKKNSSYGVGDFQFLFRYNDNTAYESNNGNVTGVQLAQSISNDTITYEIALPLALLGLDGTTISKDQLIGFDLHLNDDDNTGAREGKLAWYARADESSINPAFFGIASFSRQSEGPIADKPEFSHKRGYYLEPFELTISSGIAAAEIIYTLDGSNPKFSSTAISVAAPAKISIDPAISDNRGGLTPGVIVRALATATGYSKSDVRTHSFLFLENVVKQGVPGGQWNPEYANYAWPGIDDPQTIDYQMSSSITQSSTYIDLMDDAMLSIPSYSIVTEYKDMFDPASGIFMNALEDGWERPVSVELIDPVREKDFQQDAGIRIRGRYSRLSRNPKHSFRLMFRKEYGDGDLDFDVFDNEGPERFDRLDFRTAQNSSWQAENGNEQTVTFVKEVFARDLHAKMGHLYTKSRYCHLYLNGMYWGLFQIQERADENYATTYLGGEKSDYDVIKPRKNVRVPEEDLKMGAVAGDTEAAERLWSKVLAGMSTNEAYFEVQGMNPDGTRNLAYERLLDVQNLVDYLILSFYLGSEDGPGVVWEGLWGHTVRPNNFIGIFDKSNPDGFKWIVHDFEKTMYSTSHDFPLLETDDTWFSEEFDFFNPITLHRRLLANDEYRLLLADRVFEFLEEDGVLTPEKLTETWKNREDQIDLAVIAESARWGDWITWRQEQTKANWRNNVDWITKTYIPARTAIVLNQFKTLGVYNDVQTAKLSHKNVEVLSNKVLLDVNGEILIEDQNDPGGIIYYTLNDTDPREIGGGVSASANSIISGELLKLNVSAILSTRIKIGDDWSPIKKVELIMDESFNDLKITELHYNPRADGTTDGDLFEFIELKNTGTSTINLNGLSFIDGIEYSFSNNELVPGGFIVLASDSSRFKQRYGLTANGQYLGNLNNGGESLVLANFNGQVILKAQYNDRDPWPLTADGAGYSLVAKESSPEGIPETVEYWQSSTYINGSPFQDDPELTGNIILVNEVLSNPTEGQIDAIELYNPGSISVDVGGWYLTDDRSRPTRWQIPASSIIPAGGYLVFDEDDFGSEFGISSHGEEAFVFSADPSQTTNVIANGVRFGEVEDGFSFGNHQTSQGYRYTVAQSEQSLGNANKAPRVGPVVIEEIMYNAPAGKSDYLKLINISENVVNFSASDNETNTWKIEGINFDFPVGSTLGNGHILYVVADTVSAEKFRAMYGLPASTTVFIADGRLDNSGETISLLKPAPEYTKDNVVSFEYILIEKVKYETLEPWYPEAGLPGSWLQRIDNRTYANDPVNWKVESRLSPPVLSPDTENTLSMNNVNITFTDNQEWRNAISSVKIDNVELTSTDYTVSAGKLLITGNNFELKKDYSIVVEAAGYFNATVIQSILSGEAPLGISDNINKTYAVFPNPANSELIVTSTTGKQVYITLATVHGHVISEKPLYGERLRLDVLGLKNGIYLLTIHEAQGRLTRVISIKH